MRAAFDAEFLTRPDGYRGLSQHYGFEFAAEPVQMDPGLMYRAVADGAVDVIDGFATDGRIPAYDLAVLEDDKGFFPPYYAAPLVRADTLEQYPAIGKVLNELAGKMSDRAMQQLNYEVDEKGRKARDVATEFLQFHGLIQSGAEAGDGSAGTVTIGGKQFTEQEILGEMMATLIECSTDLTVRRRLNLGGTMICFNALKAGDLDLYPEYTGTGLMNILKHDIVRDPDEAYDTVKRDFRERFDLVWLKPFGFNNTYTLTMRRQHAEELGIRNISDLADYINAL
jgi:osmoprotectant transport system permease protein